MSKSKSTTHCRIYKDDLMDIKKEMGDIGSADVIRMSWQQYSAVQKAGRMIYGKIWKKPKK